MAEVRSRMEDPSPGIAFQEIHIPSDADLGTGTFRIEVSKDALVPPAEGQSKALAAGIVNPPVFQLSVNVIAGTRRVTVQLGPADGSLPLAARVFAMPSEVDAGVAHEFVVTFHGWQVPSVAMDGQELEGDQ